MSLATVADTIGSMSSDPVLVANSRLAVYKLEGEFVAVLTADPRIGTSKKEWAKPVKVLESGKKPTASEALDDLCDRLTLKP